MMHRTKLSIVTLALTCLAALPATAQDMDLAGKLASQLGVTPAQAAGGVQAILGTVKGKLSAEDFASLLDSSPDLAGLAAKMDGEAGAAAGAAGAAASADMGEKVAESMGDSAEMAGAMKGAAGELDLSSLSQLTGLADQFKGLGLDPGMVKKFVPALLEQLGPESGGAKLLKQGLGLM
jgi:hypothetical protein